MTAATARGSIDVDLAEFDCLLDRLQASSVKLGDVEFVRALKDAYIFVTEQIRDRNTTIGRLRKMLFGSTSEKKDDVLRPEKGGKGKGKGKGKKDPQAKGHGRNGIDDYPGLPRTTIPHETLSAGDACPHGCPKGKLYGLEPARSIRLIGQAPVDGDIGEQERFRCTVCGVVFTASEPDGEPKEKHDATAVAMVALLHYGSGLPFYRLAELQDSFGIPLPASTQWDLVHRAACLVVPAHAELTRLAAQGELFLNDDTTMKILSVMGEARARRERGEKPLDRTGVFTTGIVAFSGGHEIVLYRTGLRHAGENLRDILEERAQGLPPPKQMCDGLERNLPAPLKTIVSNCLVHMRRQFVDVVESFPDEVRHVIDELAKVYKNEDQAQAEKMTPQDRLAFHQRESKPVMDRLKAWLDAQIKEKKVEPNSGLGRAIKYARKRWERLTLFLREPGAPLDNNLCERILKRAIMHRKNSLFYKTENGARVGDLYMSLIATARQAGVDPFEYLVALQRHAAEVAKAPADWLPWNYRATLAARPPS